jgi:long-chain acyl-CoA synthetase
VVLSGKLALSLIHASREFGAATALSHPRLSLSYTDFATQAEIVSGLLSQAGLLPDEPVLVHVSNDPLDLAAFLGVWMAGGVVVPVHRTAPVAVLATAGRKSRARFLIDMLPSPDRSPAPLCLISTELPPERPLLRDAAFIIFTSGSTGAPKGVVLSHTAFHGKIAQIDSLLHFQPQERVLLVLNITFSFGIWLSLLTLLRGGTLVMQDKFVSAPFLRTLRDGGIARVGMVPTMMRVLFSDPALAPAIDDAAAAGTLRQIMIGGESLGHSLAATIRQRFAGTDLIDIYGLTETSTCDFFSFPATYARYPGCIGLPAPNVMFRIADGNGVEVAPGAVGELQIRSPYLMNGYLDEPELTATAFCGDWFRTGDLARHVGASVVEMMGRSKELISRGGNKVTPVEIEQLLCAHPDIAAAMAVGVADAVLGERIHALLIPRPGTALQIPALKNFLHDKLEKFKQPDIYYVADELPLGRTGKADRGQFKSMIESGRIAPATHA